MPTAWDSIGRLSTSGASCQTDARSRERSECDSRRPKIAIAVPYNGRWYPEWVEKTYNPLRLIGVDWCDKVPLWCKVPSISVARDILVSDALKAGCSHIFFYDSDIIFEQPTDANLALRILYQCMENKKDENVKIVSALYRAKQKTGFSWAMWNRVNKDDWVHFTPVDKWTGNWIEVDSIGLGCCLIDLEVFKNVDRPWFKWDTNEEPSEDFYFCKIANMGGYKTWVFTDIRLSHLGELKVRSDGSVVTQEM